MSSSDASQHVETNMDEIQTNLSNLRIPSIEVNIVKDDQNNQPKIEGIPIVEKQADSVMDGNSTLGNKEETIANEMQPTKLSSYPAVKMAPMAQIAVSIYDFGEKAMVYINVHTSPYDDNEINPPMHFKVQENTIVICANDDKPPKLPKKEKPGKGKANKKHPMVITIGGIECWRRANEPPHKMDCGCNSAYNGDSDPHTEKRLCQARTIGTIVSEQLWNRQPVEGTIIESHLID
ncbi:unnamed protein product [Caenorhabditis brenneri]